MLGGYFAENIRQAMPWRGLMFQQETPDTVAAYERLTLVVAPRAAVSDYVRQQWQSALQGPAAPRSCGMRYPLVPDEPKLLHIQDFLDDVKYHLSRNKPVFLV